MEITWKLHGNYMKIRERTGKSKPLDIFTILDFGKYNGFCAISIFY
jgi:hypothetical protein